MSDGILDPVLGMLTYRLKDNYWESHLALPSGQALKVMLFPGDENLELSLPIAREAFLHVCEREQEIHKALLSGMLSMYNDSWRDEEEDDPDPISGEEFIRRIQQHPATLQLHLPLDVDYSRIMYFDDGSLFAGHFIEVSFNTNSEVISAGIVG